MAITAAQLDIIFNSKGADKAKRDIDDVGGSVSRAGSGFDKLKAGALGLGTALIAPMGLGLKSAVQLEQSIANVNAALGGVDASTLDSLTTSFQDIGTASQYSAIEVANVGEELIKAGFGVEDLLGGMTQSVVDLAQATGDGLGPAMDGVVQIMSTWKTGIVDSSIAMTDASRVADILTVAANGSKAGLTDIQAGMRSLAPVAAMMGIPVEDAAAAIALFTNNGLRGADAGISLARGLQNLADPTSEAATRMDELGIAAFDANGTFVGFPSLFRQLQTGMADLDDQTKFTALSTIFGAEAMDVMGLAIMNGADPLEAMIALMGESGAAAEQSALRMDTLGAQFDTLVEGVTTFLGSLVQGLIPGMRATVDIANDFIDVLMRIPKPIKTIIGAVTAGLAAFAALNVAIKGFAAFNMLTGGAGLGLSGMLAPLLGLATAAGALYLAWEHNVFGIRDMVKQFRKFYGLARLMGTGRVASFFDAIGNVFDSSIAHNIARVVQSLGTFYQMSRALGNSPVVAMLDAFANVFDSALAANIARTISGLGYLISSLGMFYDISRMLGNTRIESFFNALSNGIRNLSGGNIPAWLESVAQGFDRLQDAVRTGGLSGLLQQVLDELGRLALWSATQALEFVIDVGISIGSWAISAAVNLGSAVWDWVTNTAIPTAAGVVSTIYGVLVSIGSWAKHTIADIWPDVTAWASEAMGTVTEAAATLWGVLVNIGSWGKGLISDIWPYVSQFAQESWDTVSANAVKIGDVAVSIREWGISAATDLWTAVSNWVTGSGGAGVGDSLMSETGGASTSVGRGPIDLGAVPVKIGDWDITIDFAGLWNEITSRFEASMVMSDDMAASITAAGHTLGLEASNLLMTAIEGVFGGGGGGGGGAEEFDITGGVGMTISHDWFDDALSLFVQGIISGIQESGIGDKIKAAIKAEFADLWADMQTTEFWFGTTNFSIPLPSISFKRDGGSTPEGESPRQTNYRGMGVEPTPIPGIGAGATTQGGTPVTSLPSTGAGPAAPDPRPFREVAAAAAAMTTAISGASAALAGLGVVMSGATMGITTFGTGLTTLTASFTTFVASTIGVMGGWSTGIQTMLMTLGMTFVTSLQAPLMAAQTAFMTFVALTIAVMGGWSGGILAIVAGAMQGMLGVTAASMAGMAAVVAGSMQAIIAVTAGSMAGFVAIIAGGMAAATGAISAGASSWPGIINGVAGAMGAAGHNAGAAAGFGVANGMLAALGAVQAASAAIAAVVTSTLAMKLLIASPSKVTAQLGEYVGEGFANGIASMVPNVQASAGQLAGAALPPVSGYAYSASGSAGRGGSGTFAPQITVNVDATGKDIDEERVANLAALRTMDAVQVALERHGRAMGGR